MSLPSGVVTFLFTDVVGSTRLWETEPNLMGAVMARHDQIIETAVAHAGGMVVRPRGEGDSRFAVFVSPRDAVVAAAAIAVALHGEPWATSTPIQVRTAIHTGEADLRAGDYYGDAVNRCARLRGIAHPGQILLTNATAGLVGAEMAAELTLTDLGEHRLKDLTRAEHIWQLHHDDLPAEFPALLSLNRARHNLPVQMSSFVGREAEIAALVDAVGEHRLVTVLGFGGMGKTRLALQAAAELGDGSADGVWFVDLAAITDSTRVPGEIATVLSIGEGADGAAPAVLRALADQNLLLVLDNLEQVLGCAHFVTELLAAAPGVHVLATSREPLRVRGEQQFPLQPMPLPDPNAAIDVVSTSEAVRLFVERAISVRPDFAVTPGNCAAVSAVCARLDGQPLALELAAARMKMLTIDSLLQRLASGQQLLTGGTLDMPERHRTLRATIAWSVDALKPDERDLLTAMSILPAHASIELIEAIAGPESDTFTLLDSLVEKSLVRTVDAGNETRYGLLVSIRDFAAESLTDSGRREYQDRHADYLARQLIDFFDAESVPESEAAWHEFVRRELDHIRAAIAHRRAHGPPTDLVRLVAGIDIVMVLLGLYAQYIELSDDVLIAGERPEYLVAILRARQLARSYLGGEVSSEERNALLEVGDRCTDPEMKVHAFIAAILASRNVAELTVARTAFDTALPLIANDRRRQGILDDRNNCLAKLLRFPDPPAAEAAARALLTGLWEDAGIARLAVLLLDRGHAAEAQEVAEPLADTQRYFVNDLIWQPYALAIRADAARATGDLDTALTLATQAFHDELDADISPHETAQILADIHRSRGELAEAMTILDGARSRVPNELNDAGAAIEWRRSVLQRHTGNAAPRDELLDETIAVLNSAGPFYGARDLLACAVEKAARVLETDPAYAARLLGWVRANRKDWVLPFGMDDEIEPLLTRLLPEHAGEHKSAVVGDPFPTEADRG